MAVAKKQKVKDIQASEEKVVSLGKYVVSYDKENKNWKISRDGAKRIIDSKATKAEALERVKQLSINNDAGFVVKKKDGKFQKK